MGDGLERGMPSRRPSAQECRRQTSSPTTGEHVPPRTPTSIPLVGLRSARRPSTRRGDSEECVAPSGDSDDTPTRLGGK